MLAAIRISVTRDAETGAAIDDHLIGLTASDSVEFEQYLVLRQALERLHAASGVSVLAITSATVNEGKTTTAINLAAALARNRQARVLLVDADLRVPSVAIQLGMIDWDGPGLADVLADPGLPLTDAIRRRPTFNLSVLPAGQLRDANPYELFQSTRFGSVVAELRRAYDYVVFDAPPAVPVPDCRLIEACVDGFLIVVAAHHTPRRLLAEALTIVGPEKSLGLVFNRVDAPFRGYYDAYYGYGGYTSRGRARR
ncbi:MAG: CpsD/CapB family tyrosine-protein kinase [Acidobacteria bacterium]|nr:CpsD/CapB family tyrosine-protein kinase [Acidobacteriota bacterium]